MNLKSRQRFIEIDGNTREFWERIPTIAETEQSLSNNKHDREYSRSVDRS